MANHGHDAHGHAPVSHGSDKGAAFTGLFGGLIFLIAVVYGIVVWTNGKYAGHGAAGSPPAAGAPKH